MAPQALLARVPLLHHSRRLHAAGASHQDQDFAITQGTLASEAVRNPACRFGLLNNSALFFDHREVVP